MSKTYCPLPWNHFSTHTDGIMRVCCNSTSAGRLTNNDGTFATIDKIENISDFYNIDHLKDIRKKMLSGERTSECNYCYAIEDNGGISVRQSFAKSWPIESFLNSTDPDTGEINDVKINYLDLSWSNKCNLQCKMCTPAASDQLIAESKIIHDNKAWLEWDFKQRWDYKKIKDILEKTVTENLNQILVTGGEPLINNDFYEFCNMLISTGLSKQIDMSIHTNLTVTPKKWFNIWKYFKSMTIKVSIDAVEEMYEYVRYPGKWKILKQNIEDTIEFSKTVNGIGIEFHTVLSIFNTEKFTDLLDYISSLQGGRVVNVPHINYVYDPSYASPSNLPTEYKLKVHLEIMSWINNNKERFQNNKVCMGKIAVLESALNILINSTVSDGRKQYSYNIIKKMDNYRKHNTELFLPWMGK
jgi:MoaA/NifB/PqqE/SkfB family radical SAM enzyme